MLKAACCAELQDLLPGIINQLGPDNLSHLKKIAQQVCKSYPTNKRHLCQAVSLSITVSFLAISCNRQSSAQVILESLHLPLWSLTGTGTSSFGGAFMVA